MIDVLMIEPGDTVKVKIDPGYSVVPYMIEGEAYLLLGRLYVGPAVIRDRNGDPEKGRTILSHTPKRWAPPERCNSDD